MAYLWPLVSVIATNSIRLILQRSPIKFQFCEFENDLRISNKYWAGEGLFLSLPSASLLIPFRPLSYSAVSTWERSAKWQPYVSLNVGKVLHCKDTWLCSTVVLKLTHGVEALLCRTDDLDSWPPAYLLIIVFTTEYGLPLLFNTVRRQALNWEYN